MSDKATAAALVTIAVFGVATAVLFGAAFYNQYGERGFSRGPSFASWGGAWLAINFVPRFIVAFVAGLFGGRLFAAGVYAGLVACYVMLSLLHVGTADKIGVAILSSAGLVAGTVGALIGYGLRRQQTNATAVFLTGVVPVFFAAVLPLVVTVLLKR